jgi:hypothetical protein
MKLSVIVSVRKNSKFIGKLLYSVATKTKNSDSIEMLLMTNENDTWNKDMFKLLEADKQIRIFKENYKYGRAGLHKYFEALLPHTTGEWVLYLCDDHDVAVDGWDQKIFDLINSNQLDYKKIYQIVPHCVNTGSVIHILSRGWIDTTHEVGKHPNVDSYLNYVAERLPSNRIYHVYDKLFIDYTCMPEIMTPEHCKTEIDPLFPTRNFTTDPTVMNDIISDVNLLITAIGKGL